MACSWVNFTFTFTLLYFTTIYSQRPDKVTSQSIRHCVKRAALFPQRAKTCWMVLHDGGSFKTTRVLRHHARVITDPCHAPLAFRTTCACHAELFIYKRANFQQWNINPFAINWLNILVYTDCILFCTVWVTTVHVVWVGDMEPLDEGVGTVDNFINVLRTWNTFLSSTQFTRLESKEAY
jgi:hypothetical protein